MLKNSSVKELNSFFLVILLISLLLLIIIIWGGYRILKKAFEPVDKISKTALSIQKSKYWTGKQNGLLYRFDDAVLKKR